jgi:transcriptional regulator with XRE-family HTH domain
MACPFKELRDRMSTASRVRVDKRVRASLRALRLAELRRHVSGLKQSEVAELMAVTQGAISQLEQREDVLLSNLAAYIRALGGTLELVARFPKADVLIAGFQGTTKPGSARAAAARLRALRGSEPETRRVPRRRAAGGASRKRTRS